MKPIKVALVVNKDVLSAFIMCGDNMDFLGDVHDNRRELFGLVGPKEILFTIETKLDEETAEFYLNAFEQAGYKYYIGDNLYVAL